METNSEPYCNIPMSNNSNHTAKVSEQDYALVRNYKWSLYEFKDDKRYRVFILTRIDGKLTHMHHLIMGKPKSKQEVITHRNNDKLDNRRCNLVATQKKHSLKRTVEPMEDNDNYNHTLF